VLVDVTHDIPPHDVLQGALQLSAASASSPLAPSSWPWSNRAPAARRGIAVEAGSWNARRDRPRRLTCEVRLLLATT
jgi:hypothetical protein